MTHKKVYRGWIDPKHDLPKKRHLQCSNQILFGSLEVNRNEFPCKITVEWTEAKRKGGKK